MPELEALTNLYNTLIDQHRLSAPGFSPQRISYAIDLDPVTGKMNGLVSMKVEELSKTKPVLRPANMDVPTTMGNRAGKSLVPRFLWDNAFYLFGFHKPGADNIKVFETERAFHHQVLDPIKDDPVAHAILCFFDAWDATDPESATVLAEYKDELTKGCNLVFTVGGALAHEDPAIRARWQEYYNQDDESDVIGTCLVTGERGPIARTHPKIKGVRGGQPTGTSLVSFNFDAACHYGKTQGYNAPVSKYAAFAYTSALNYLLSEQKSVYMVNNTTVVCWSENAEGIYNQFAGSALFGQRPPEGMTDDDVMTCIRKLAAGEACETFSLYPERKFYMLGLDPNAGRLAVRFFEENNFGSFMRNVSAHYDRMEIIRSPTSYLPRSVYQIMLETVKRPAPGSNKKPEFDPMLSGAVTQAILNGTRYPYALSAALIRRIRAERSIYAQKAALLKAFYLNNHNPGCPVEICTPELNEDSIYTPYLLGRLFAWAEMLQKALQTARNPGVKPSPFFRKRYLSSAAATPAHMFSMVINPSIEQNAKALGCYRNNFTRGLWFRRQAEALQMKIGYDIPLCLTMAEQAAFFLGYYHQNNTYYGAKAGEEDGSKNESEGK